MKRVILTVSLFSLLALTSCNDYMRDQDQKDAQSEGKSILMKAEYSKRADIEEAKAKFESSKLDAQRRILLSQAKIEEAKANAKSTVIEAEAERKWINIMSDALGSKENYLTYMKYKMMYSGKGNKYFVATEANLPLMLQK